MPGRANPAAKVRRYRVGAPQIRYLKLGQIEDQLEDLEKRPLLRAAVAVLIFAGLRREELLWLTLDDVNLKAGNYGMISIRAKNVDGLFWEPKTKVNRAVPVSSRLRHYLDRYERRIVPGRWFFPSPEGKQWNPDNFSRSLRKVNKKAGLSWACLDFRHTFGTQLALKGESLYKISALMGNSPEICRRHYAAMIPEALTDSVEFGSPPRESETGPPPAVSARFHRRNFTR